MSDFGNEANFINYFLWKRDILNWKNVFTFIYFTNEAAEQNNLHGIIVTQFASLVETRNGGNVFNIICTEWFDCGEN